MKTLTDLEAWKKARELRNEVSALVRSFPPEEKYRLTDQIIRASRSVGANIAEGYGRFHYIDSSKFFVNARGSASETIEHLYVALDERYIDQVAFEKLRTLCEDSMKLINGYISFLRNQASIKPKT
jgi:four helix bundle protein